MVAGWRGAWRIAHTSNSGLYTPNPLKHPELSISQQHFSFKDILLTLNLPATKICPRNRSIACPWMLKVKQVLYIKCMNLLPFRCSSSCTHRCYKEMLCCTWLHSWVWRIHQLCNIWSILHCMTSYHSKLGTRLNGFLHPGQSSTYRLLWNGLDS